MVKGSGRREAKWLLRVRTGRKVAGREEGNNCRTGGVRGVGGFQRNGKDAERGRDLQYTKRFCRHSSFCNI